jgi:hypothetical protein
LGLGGNSQNRVDDPSKNKITPLVPHDESEESLDTMNKLRSQNLDTGERDRNKLLNVSSSHSETRSIHSNSHVSGLNHSTVSIHSSSKFNLNNLERLSTSSRHESTPNHSTQVLDQLSVQKKQNLLDDLSIDHSQNHSQSQGQNDEQIVSGIGALKAIGENAKRRKKKDFNSGPQTSQSLQEINDIAKTVQKKRKRNQSNSGLKDEVVEMKKPSELQMIGMQANARRNKKHKPNQEHISEDIEHISPDHIITSQSHNIEMMSTHSESTSQNKIISMQPKLTDLRSSSSQHISPDNIITSEQSDLRSTHSDLKKDLLVRENVSQSSIQSDTSDLDQDNLRPMVIDKEDKKPIDDSNSLGFTTMGNDPTVNRDTSGLSRIKNGRRRDTQSSINRELNEEPLRKNKLIDV